MHSLPETLRNRKATSIKATLLALCAAVLLVAAPSTLHAAPITYDLTLTPGAGSTIGGTGSLTIEGAPVSPGVSTYTVALGNLDNLSFNLAGQSFSLPGVGNALVQFVDGSLTDITFAQELGRGTDNRFSLQTSGVYAFYYNNELSGSFGTFTATPASSPSPVPEPSSLLLFATGLIGAAGLLYFRMAPQTSSATSC